MEDKKEKLYNLFLSKKLITDKVSLDMWNNISIDQQKALFELGKKSNLFKTVNVDQFVSLWDNEVKKKEISESPSQSTELDSTSITSQEDFSSDTTQALLNESQNVSSSTGDLEEELTTDTEMIDPNANNQPEEVTIETQEVQEDINQIPIEEIKTDVKRYNPLGSGTNKQDLEVQEKNTWVENIFGENETTDFFGDLGRAWIAGQKQGGSVDESLALMRKGADVSDQDLEEFISAQKEMQAQGESDEMKSFNSIYQKEGGGFFGWLKGVRKNPTVLPQLFVSSVSAMVNPTVIGAGAVGAGAGLIATPVGSLALAMGAMSTTLETALTYSELLQEQLGDDELNVENLRGLLENEDKMFDLKMKSAARGVTIGVIDGLTSGLASRVGAKVMGKSIARTKGKILKGGAAVLGVESAGGMVGEVGGRLAAGQEMDAAEILFEGFTGGIIAPVNVGWSMYQQPLYTVNNRNEMNKGDSFVSSDQMNQILEESSDADFAMMELSATNDKKTSEAILKRKTQIKQDAVIRGNIRQAGSSLNDAQVDAILPLQKEINDLKESNNNTEVSKRRQAELRLQIEEIQESDFYKSVETDDKGNTKTTNIEVSEDFAKQELIKEGNENPTKQEIDAKQAEIIEEQQKKGEEINNENLKEKEDAVQESSPENVDVQESTEGSAEVGEGINESTTTESNQETETVTTEESQTEVVQEEIRPTTKREKQPVRRNIPKSKLDIEIDSEGNVQVVDRKTGRPYKKKLPPKVQEYLLKEGIDVNEGKTSEQIFNEKNPDRDIKDIGREEAGDISLQSENVREVAGLIDVEQSMIDQANEENQQIDSMESDLDDNDLIDMRGLLTMRFSQESLAKYFGSKGVNPQTGKKRGGRISEFIGKRFIAKSGEGISIEDGVTLNGKTLTAGEIVDYISQFNNQKDIDAAFAPDKTKITSLKETFKKLTGLNPTKKNIAAVLSVDPNRAPLQSILQDIESQQQAQSTNQPATNKNKKNVSAKKIVEGTKENKEVTVDEAKALKDQIKLEQNAANKGIKFYRKAQKNLIGAVKSLQRKGIFNSKQVNRLVKKIVQADALSVDKTKSLLKEIDAVFKEAETNEQRKDIANKVKKAKKNINSGKIGIANAIVPMLDNLFNIKIDNIPAEVLNTYQEIVDQLGENKSVLKNVEKEAIIIEKTQKVLKALDEQQSMLPDLKTRLAEYIRNNPNMESKGFSKILDKMTKDEVINSDEAALMKKYKSQISSEVKESKKATPEELKVEKETLIDDLLDNGIKSKSQVTRIERDLVLQLRRLMSNKTLLEGLSNLELKNLTGIVENINNGYVPHLTQIMASKLSSIQKGKLIGDAVGKAKLLIDEKIIAKVKTFFRDSTTVAEMVRRNPLVYIDQLFNNFKTMPIYDAALGGLAAAQPKFKKAVNDQNQRLKKAKQKVLDSHGGDINLTVKSGIKQSLYMIQREFESNPNDPLLNPAIEYARETIKNNDKIGSESALRESKMIEEVIKEFTEISVERTSESLVGVPKSGKISLKKLSNSFNTAESQNIETIDAINTENESKAVYASTVIRGKRFNPRKNYFHLSVAPKSKKDKLNAGGEIIDNYLNSVDVNKPSTKGQSLIDRTGAVSPLNLDPWASTARGAKYVNLDYYMTVPVREARGTLKQAEINLLGDKERLSSQDREILNAIDGAVEQTLNNVLSTNFEETSWIEDGINSLQKQGYRAILAGAGRFVAELMSNLFFGFISNPGVFTKGLLIRDVAFGNEGANILDNLNSSQTTRIFGDNTLDSKMVDINVLNERSGTENTSPVSDTENMIMKIWNKTGKKLGNLSDLTADALISTPDKLIMKPIWFGSFATEFKNLTGVQPDFEKIAANDEAYMNANAESLSLATKTADGSSVRAGATDNPFMGILKGQPQANQSIMIKAFNNFNNFMTRFLIYEFSTARLGVKNLIGQGNLSEGEGASIIAAVTARMVTYTLLSQLLADALLSAFDLEDKDDKDIDKKIGQAMGSAFTSLVLGRNFGNFIKMGVAQGVETFNEEHLDFLRDGEYDPYKDALQYRVVPKSKKGQGNDLGDYILRMAGGYGPIINTANFALKKATEPQRKEDAAIARQKKEINTRIPLELLGNLGFIPLYKDVKRVVLADIYKDVRNDKKKLTTKELQELKTSNPTEYKKEKANKDKSRKIKAYEKKVKEYKVYVSNPNKWKRENPGKVRPRRPKRLKLK